MPTEPGSGRRLPGGPDTRPDGEEAPDVCLRQAESADSDAVAELYGAARNAAVPDIPPPVHTAEEDRAYFAGLLGGPAEAWVAELVDATAVGDAAAVGDPAPDPLVAFLVLDGNWLHSLYVRPGLTGRGIGAALLSLAKSLRPAGFALWVFESNHGARRFYEREGLVEVRRTDGSGNEERAPDIELAWPGRSG